MKDKSVEARIINNYKDINYNDAKIFANTSNITGLSLEKHFIKKNKENNKINYIKGLSKLSPLKRKGAIESNLYPSLTKKEKIKYIQKMIKNCISKEPYDCLAVKRKKYSLSYLIHQFDLIEKSKSFEENKICKTPYPLIYCISNRKVGNDASNLLVKILTSENKKLSKKQEKVIKYSIYSKMFTADILDLIKNKIRSKSTLKKSYSHIVNNNINNISKIYSNKKMPFLNKFIKSKVNSYKYGLLNRNDNYNKYPTSVGFSSDSNIKKYKLIKNMKRWNSTFSINGRDNLMYKTCKNYQYKNIVESFKNKTVCLHNHKNNIINNSIIKERSYKILDECFYSKRNIKSDPKFNEIIKDVSHLKFNNQIIPFNTKIKEL